MSVPWAHEPGILARATCDSVRRRGSKQKVSNSLESKVFTLGFTVPYLKINFISCFLLYSWLARPTFNKQPSCPPVYDWLNWSGRVRQVISPVDDNFRCSLKRVRQPVRSLPDVHYRWTFCARETRPPTSSSPSRFAHKGCCFFLDPWSIHSFQSNQRFQAIEFVDQPFRKSSPSFALIFPKLCSQKMHGAGHVAIFILSFHDPLQARLRPWPLLSTTHEK